MNIKLKFNKDFDVSENCKFLINDIKKFQQQNSYIHWKKSIIEITKLDSEIIDNRVLKIFLDNFSFLKNRYTKNILGFSGILKQISRYIILFFFNFFFKKLSNNSNKYKLLIDNITSADQLDRYESLIKLFGKENVFGITKDKSITLKKIDFKFIPKIFNYKINYFQIFILIKLFFLNSKITFKEKVNFFYLSNKIINEFYWYSNLFKNYNFKNIIMEKHYYSNNIKNHLFKKSGGNYSCLIQKNINILNTNGFVYDADILFSYSEKVNIDRVKTLSNIKKNISVGSFFMENFSKRVSININNEISNESKYDIVCIGGNELFPKNNFYNSYNSYSDDYLLHLDLLKKISIDLPDLKVGFKHHSNNKFFYEEDYLKNSNVIIIDQKRNSYKVALNSKFICSWASTMIIEMTTFRKFCYFLDPGLRNKQFLDDIKDSEFIRIKNYSEFLEKYEIAKNKNFLNLQDPYCLPSNDVSNKIYQILKT